MMTLVLGESLWLVSPWKPVILLLTLGAWAWVVSAIFDKHADRFRLNRESWGLVHLLFGCAAVIVGFVGVPMRGEVSFWIGWALMLVVLGANLVTYAVVVNKDERVPAEYKIKLDILTKMAEKRAAKKEAKQAVEVKLVIRGADKQVVPAPPSDSPEAVVRVAAEEVYLGAIAARASQVDVVPVKDGAYAVSRLIDGVRAQQDPMPAQQGLAIMDFWKACGKLDVADRRRKLTSEIVVDHKTTRHKVRLTSIGVSGGMRLTMLFDPEAAVKRPAADLGLLDVQMEELRKMVDDAGRGVVLLGSTPDGGRTTTLYSITAMHDAYTQSVQVVEIEPQGTLEGVRHQIFDPQAEGADFGTLVRSMLRREPDVLSVAEMPDANTAKEVAKSEIARTRTYLSLRADSALGAIQTYAQAVGDTQLVSRGLRGVVVGRLVRKLCPNCRVPYPPTAAMLQKLGVPEGKVQQLFKKGGQVLIKNKPETCPTCAGVGYLGQEGIFEIYTLDDECRDLLATANYTGLKAALRKRNLPTLQQAAIRKALLGITSVDEVQRVTAPPAAAAPAGPAKA